MSLLLVNLNTVVAVLCVLMAMHLLFQKISPQPAVQFLGGCFLVLGLHALLLGFNLTYGANPITAALQPTMSVLFGPLAYLMFQHAFQTKARSASISLLHLVPATAVFVLMLSEQGRLFADFAILFSLLGYALLLSNLSWRRKSAFQVDSKYTVETRQGLNKTLYLWLVVFTGYSWLILTGDVMIYFEIGAGSPTIESIALLLTITFKLLVISFTTFLALHKSPLFDWLYTSFSIPNTKTIPPEKLEAFKDVIQSFEQLVEESAVYTQELVTLKTMAERLGVTPRLFSNAINHHYGESYTKRMNRLRVNYAKRLLVEQPECSIMAVMFDSGFQTKSSFNKEFKTLIGLSPSEYREKHIGNSR